MAVAGIVAEFDPFHLGHWHLVREIRASLGEETPIVAAMSAAFTQRGDAAVCTASARAEMAVRGGVNLVLELPVGFSTAASETFARGGVGVLSATGVVDTLCFGSECADIASLRLVASTLQNPDYSALLRKNIEKGISFASARMQALESILGSDIPTGPNDLLAISYLSVLPKHMHALAIARRDAGHEGMQSSARVRTLLRSGDLDGAGALVPESCGRILRRETERGTCPGDLKYAERAILYRLRTMSPADFAAICDCTEGLENRMAAQAGRAVTLDGFYAAVKSKRYAHSRIRRIVLRAFLGIDAPPEQVSYLRVLAADEKGLALLRQMKRTASLPVITKSAHGRYLPENAQADFFLSRKADDLWGLCLEKVRNEGEGWKDTPVIVTSEKN